MIGYASVIVIALYKESHTLTINCTNLFRPMHFLLQRKRSGIKEIASHAKPLLTKLIKESSHMEEKGSICLPIF